jgi:hypothetical protein
LNSITTQPSSTQPQPEHTPVDAFHRLEQRQRQIDFGKNTLGYVNYLKQVPKNQRKTGDPRTPDPRRECSKRSFDGLIRSWRRKLHAYDPSKADDEIEIDLGDDENQLDAIEQNLNGSTKKTQKDDGKGALPDGVSGSGSNNSNKPISKFEEAFL